MARKLTLKVADIIRPRNIHAIKSAELGYVIDSLILRYQTYEGFPQWGQFFQNNF